MKKIILVFILLSGIIMTGSCQQKQKEKTITADSLQVVLKTEKVVVLDVRTPEEYAEGHLQGALNIDYRNENFAARVDSLDKTQKYEVYCRSGQRSGESVKIMTEKGFNAYNLTGGILEWQQKGFEVVK